MNEVRMVKSFVSRHQWAKNRKDDIERWLYNFTPEHRPAALELLKHIQVFTTSDIQNWSKFLHGYLPPEVTTAGRQTRYVGLGLASESGSLVAYHYRSQNNLAVDLFLEPRQVIDTGYLSAESVKNIIFLDDFVGSGNQAIEFWKTLDRHLGPLATTLNFHYSALVAYKEGIDNIERNTGFKHHSVKQLDESDKAFGLSSNIFPSYAREIMRNIFRDYGVRLFPKHPLGYKDGQALIVFEHNTPNNCLPILWSNHESWYPLFRRSEKVRLPSTETNMPAAGTEGALNESADLALLLAEVIPVVVSPSQSPHHEDGSSIELERQHTDMLAEVLRMTHGRLLNTPNHGLVTVFAYCSDAVRCAFMLQERVRLQNAAETPGQSRYGLKIGIAYGQTSITNQGSIQGDVVGQAEHARLACPVNEVYITDSVRSRLRPKEVQVEPVSIPRIIGQVEADHLFRLVQWLGIMETVPNPFTVRDGIRRSEDFFGRDKELSDLRAFLRGRQNCQIVGPSRIGKSSLLRQVERDAHDWDDAAVVAFLDLQHPDCFTLSGLFQRIARQFKWPTAPRSLEEFAARIDTMLGGGEHPVLCMDTFEVILTRHSEFTSDFLLMLRACGQEGLSIFTTSQLPLNRLTPRGDPSSPFYNTFPEIRIDIFSPEDVQDFLLTYRPGVPAFTAAEKEVITSFSKNHPLALQIICFHIIQAKVSQEDLSTAVKRATEEIKSLIPQWESREEAS